MLRSKVRTSAVALAIALATGLASSVAFGVDLQLSDDDIARAVQQGIDQARSPDHGFQVKDYVLFGVTDPLRISAGGKLVDAVIVATPREQVLYQSYLAEFEGKPLSPAKGRSVAGQYEGRIGFRVFAHSRGLEESDRDFLKAFGRARLTVGGKDYPASSSNIFGPGQDFFILPDGQHVMRWLGSVTFVFDASKLPSTSGPMTLTFDDGEGQSYSYDVDLGGYQ